MRSEALVSADAIRMYVRTLRQEQDISQDAVARAMGLSRRAYIDWEMGRSNEAKTSPLLRAVKFLGGALDDLTGFTEGASAEDGAQAARSWLSEREQNQLGAATAGLTPEQAQQVVARLTEVLSDPRRAAAFVRAFAAPPQSE